MKKLIAACLAFVSCGAEQLDPPCGVVSAGDYDSRTVKRELEPLTLAKLVNDALLAGQRTWDSRLGNSQEACGSLNGFRVFTRPHPFHWDPYPYLLSGVTLCQSSLIVVRVPYDDVWEHSALVHEFFHAMQHCHTRKPARAPDDEPRHENWGMDGLNAAEVWASKCLVPNTDGGVDCE